VPVDVTQFVEYANTVGVVRLTKKSVSPCQPRFAFTVATIVLLLTVTSSTSGDGAYANAAAAFNVGA
jgi:hypothetical protein